MTTAYTEQITVEYYHVPAFLCWETKVCKEKKTNKDLSSSLSLPLLLSYTLRDNPTNKHRL